jgi:uncharacterized membrane protein
LFVPGIGDVIGLLGGTLGVLIMLVFPAFIFMKVFSEDMHSTTNKLLVLALLVAAVLCFSSVCMRV